MYQEFTDYICSIQVANLLLRENMFKYTLFQDYIEIRKTGFLNITIKFIKDEVTVFLEISDDDMSVSPFIKYIEKNFSNAAKYYSVGFGIYQFFLRFTNYEEFIKFIDKYILDL